MRPEYEFEEAIKCYVLYRGGAPQFQNSNYDWEKEIALAATGVKCRGGDPCNLTRKFDSLAAEWGVAKELNALRITLAEALEDVDERW